jgi:OHCU decarboxylase
VKLTPRTSFAGVILCFLVSGAAGLIYQVVWTRYLALFLGHTSYAVIAVLVAFMGGLALGNAWSGGWADRSARPLALYGWLELGIAGYALVFPSYYDLCHFTYVGLAARLGAGSGGLFVLKLLFSFATVLLPTVLMGATFPVLTRFVTRSLSELRSRVGALYFINSAGAVLGCLVADFWWIPDYGLQMTVFGAAALNVCAGLGALCMSKVIGEERVDAAGPGPAEVKAEECFSSGELRLALIRAHPDLADKTQRAAGLTAESHAEQNSIGLDRLSDAEYDTFERVNNAYRSKFGFPYIVCVRRQTRDSILRDFERRLPNDAATEIQKSIEEICRIAARD